MNLNAVSGEYRLTLGYRVAPKSLPQKTLIKNHKNGVLCVANSNAIEIKTKCGTFLYVFCVAGDLYLYESQESLMEIVM